MPANRKPGPAIVRERESLRLLSADDAEWAARLDWKNYMREKDRMEEGEEGRRNILGMAREEEKACRWFIMIVSPPAIEIYSSDKIGSQLVDMEL